MSVTRSGSTTEDIKKDLSPAQLAGIGAVAMAWNDVEFMLDCCLYSGLTLSGFSWTEVLHRIQPDPKIDLLKVAMINLSLPQPIQDSISVTISAIGHLKTLRNNTVHCRIYNAPEAVGIIGKRGKFSEVLLSEEALDLLYERLALLKEELRAVLALFDLHRTGAQAVRTGLITEHQFTADTQVASFLQALTSLHQRQKALTSRYPAQY